MHQRPITSDVACPATSQRMPRPVRFCLHLFFMLCEYLTTRAQAENHTAVLALFHAPLQPVPSTITVRAQHTRTAIGLSPPTVVAVPVVTTDTGIMIIAWAACAEPTGTHEPSPWLPQPGWQPLAALAPQAHGGSRRGSQPAGARRSLSQEPMASGPSSG